MIYTLTLNPAIDVLVSVNDFKLGMTNKVVEQTEIIGGKGINAAVMLAHFGEKVTALGFLGLEQSAKFYEYLKAEKINPDFTIVHGSNRNNIKIYNKLNQSETELNCFGFTVCKDDVDLLLRHLKATITKKDILLISGSIAPGSNPDIYQEIAQFCQEQEILFAIDTTKDNLLPTLEYKPFLIKPNLAELNEIFNTKYDFNNIDQIIELGQKLRKKGAQNVLISNGKEGSILVTKQNVYQVNSATGRVFNSVGAGDAMFAAFIFTYLKTKNYEKSLQCAAAAGSSTAFCLGITDLKKITEILPQIEIHKIKI